MLVNQDLRDFQNSLRGLTWIVGQILWVPVRNIGRVRSLERVVLASHRIGREKVSGLGEVAECVALRACNTCMCSRTRAPTPWRTGDEAVVVVHSIRNQSFVRALMLEVKKERDRERERENRIGRRERAELRSAELPFLRTCLAASSSSPTDYDRLLLSFCAHLARPRAHTLSFLFFLQRTWFYIHLFSYLDNCFVAESRDKQIWVRRRFKYNFEELFSSYKIHIN